MLDQKLVFEELKKQGGIREFPISVLFAEVKLRLSIGWRRRKLSGSIPAAAR